MDKSLYNCPKGFSDKKGDPNYWLDAVRECWAELGIDTDEIELIWIINWFDKRREREMQEKG